MMGSFDGGVDGERISRLEEWTASKKKWSDCQLPVNDVGVIDERRRGEASVELRQEGPCGRRHFGWRIWPTDGLVIPHVERE
jgi:hypothetical protein